MRAHARRRVRAPTLFARALQTGGGDTESTTNEERDYNAAIDHFMELCAEARKVVAEGKTDKAQTAAIRAANQAAVTDAGLHGRRAGGVGGADGVDRWGDTGFDENEDGMYGDPPSSELGGRRKRSRAEKDQGFESIAHDLVQLNRESVSLRRADFEHTSKQDDSKTDLSIAQYNLEVQRYKDDRKERALDRAQQQDDREEQRCRRRRTATRRRRSAPRSSRSRKPTPR